MRDIQRIGNLSEEFAYFRASAVCCSASCADEHYYGENNQNRDSLVDSIRNALFPTYTRQGENGDKNHGCPPEPASEPERAAARVVCCHSGRQDARDEKSAQERVEQSSEPYEYLAPFKTPAADDIVLRFSIEYAEEIPAEREVQCQHSAADAQQGKDGNGQFSEYQGIKDVAYIFVCQ